MQKLYQETYLLSSPCPDRINCVFGIQKKLLPKSSARHSRALPTHMFRFDLILILGHVNFSFCLIMIAKNVQIVKINRTFCNVNKCILKVGRTITVYGFQKYIVFNFLVMYSRIQIGIFKHTRFLSYTLIRLTRSVLKLIKP